MILEKLGLKNKRTHHLGDWKPAYKFHEKSITVTPKLCSEGCKIFTRKIRKCQECNYKERKTQQINSVNLPKEEVNEKLIEFAKNIEKETE